MNRIPPIITPLNEDSGDINSLWYRYWQSLANQSSGIPDAPSDGTLYGRKDAAWQPVPSAEPVNLGYLEATNKGTITNTGGTGAEIPVFSTASAGLTPPSGIADQTRFLRDDGQWAGISFNEVLFRGYWSAKVSTHASSTITNYGGGDYGSTSGTLIATPPYSEVSPYFTLPKQIRRCSGLNAAAGWSAAVSPDVTGPRFCSLLGSGGFFLKMLFGTGETVAPFSTIQMQAGPRFNPVGFPAFGNEITASAPAWFGVYKTNADSTLQIGYKAAGTTVITNIGSLGVSWGPQIVLYMTVLSSLAGISYSVYQVTAIKQLTLLSSGFVSVGIPRGNTCTPGFGVLSNSAGNNTDIFFTAHDFWHDLGGMPPV